MKRARPPAVLPFELVDEELDELELEEDDPAELDLIMWWWEMEDGVAAAV